MPARGIKQICGDTRKGHPWLETLAALSKADDPLRRESLQTAGLVSKCRAISHVFILCAGLLYFSLRLFQLCLAEFHDGPESEVVSLLGPIQRG